MITLIDSILAGLGVQNPEEPSLAVTFTKTEDGLKIETLPEGNQDLAEYFRQAFPEQALQHMDLNVGYAVQVSMMDGSTCFLNGEPCEKTGAHAAIMSREMRHSFGKPLELLENALRDLPSEEDFTRRVRYAARTHFIAAAIDGHTEFLRPGAGAVKTVCRCGRDHDRDEVRVDLRDVIRGDTGLTAAILDVTAATASEPDPGVIEIPSTLPHDGTFYPLVGKIFEAGARVVLERVEVEVLDELNDKFVTAHRAISASA